MKRQSGFTAIEGLLIFIIIAIIGGTGWYVWHSKQNADKSYNSNNSTLTKRNSTSVASGPVQTLRFSELPSGLKQAVLTNAPCVKDGQLLNEVGSVDDSKIQLYIESSAALIGQCQSVALYVYKDSQWAFIDKTQLAFSCSTLKKYNVPVKLMNAAIPNSQCLDSSNNEVPYNG